MARNNKLSVLNKMAAAPMVPVFYHKDAEVAKAVVKACYGGGVRLFEFTNRGDFAHEVFAEVSKFVAEECPEMALGVGSIVEPATAGSLHAAWCRFRGGTAFQPRSGKDMQPSRCALRARMRKHQRDRIRAGGWVRRVQSSSPAMCSVRRW